MTHALTTAEAAALSYMTGYEYIPYEHPPAPPLEKCWEEIVSTPFMTMYERAKFHGISEEALEQLILKEENPEA